MAAIWQIIGGIALLLTGGALTRCAVHNARRAWLIKRIRVSRIGDLKTGYVAVHGRVMAIERTLEAPISGKACVYFQVHIDLIDTNPPDPPGPAASGTLAIGEFSGVGYRCDLDTHRVGVPFAVNDGSGLVEIDPQHAEIQLHSGCSGKFSHSKADALARAMSHYGTLQFEETDTRYEETILEEGCSVLVMGSVVREGRRVRLAHGRHPLIVADRNRGQLFRRYCVPAIGWTIMTVAVVAIAACVWWYAESN